MEKKTKTITNRKGLFAIGHFLSSHLIEDHHFTVDETIKKVSNWCSEAEFYLSQKDISNQPPNPNPNEKD